ncbi:Fur family transcriptional regulator [Geofilum sp. OHC36d9]|uniref:Fur family transcriptional regulator n=1 Tax=Geofilum sp. OHC36d9 TaxID=3458413 RepID=UPI0040335605
MVANYNFADELLRSKKLNITDIRRQVVAALLEPAKALTQKEIEEVLVQNCENIDRVTLYRTIKTLLNKGIIHQITIDVHTVKYKLAGEHKKNDHPHFHCCQCDRLVCMPQIKIQEDMLPGGYSMQSSQVVIEGICPECNKKIYSKPQSTDSKNH